MPTKKAPTRDLLLHAATKVTYENGFANAALADIAAEAQVPLGNIYYYFKTKDDIGSAIVELRLSRFKKLLQEFDHVPTPKERLCAFVQTKIKNRKNLPHGGCPVSTLCPERQKHAGPAAKRSSP